VPVKGALVPVLVTFTDPAIPGPHVWVLPDEAEGALGKAFVSLDFSRGGAERLWPLDFGGPLGEPVTRGIEAKLPWWNGADNPAGRALQAARLQTGEAIDPKQTFTRKQ